MKTLRISNQLYTFYVSSSLEILYIINKLMFDYRALQM